MDGQYWCPRGDGSGVGYAGDTCRPTPAHRMLNREAVGGVTGNNEKRTSPPVAPILRPTLVIWWSEGCPACVRSKPVFDYLERHPGPFDVRRVLYEVAYRERFPHVLAVPMYDVVLPSADTGSAGGAYGPGVVVESVRNNDLSDATGLGRWFPGILAAAAGTQT